MQTIQTIDGKYIFRTAIPVNTAMFAARLVSRAIEPITHKVAASPSALAGTKRRELCPSQGGTSDLGGCGMSGHRQLGTTFTALYRVAGTGGSVISIPRYSANMLPKRMALSGAGSCGSGLWRN